MKEKYFKLSDLARNDYQIIRLTPSGKVVPVSFEELYEVLPWVEIDTEDRNEKPIKR